jgi:aspartate dehydrogenase
VKIAIIGHGAIAQYVRAKLPDLKIEEVAEIVRPSKETSVAGATPKISDLQALPAKPNLIVDCGGHAALKAHGAAALEMGIDVLTVSLGALADPTLEAALNAAATRGNARLHLATGAIGGLDALRGASVGNITSVSYLGRKPPAGWLGSPAETTIDLDAIVEPTAHFEGTARDAALQYPKNANVAAAVAFSGIGLDATKVTLIADPTVSSNIHEVHVAGEFGSFQFTISGNGLPANPKSSALAAMSVVAFLAERQKQIGF